MRLSLSDAKKRVKREKDDEKKQQISRGNLKIIRRKGSKRIKKKKTKKKKETFSKLLSEFDNANAPPSSIMNGIRAG